MPVLFSRVAPVVRIVAQRSISGVGCFSIFLNFEIDSLLQMHGSKVALLGAAGGIGQPLGMLLKLNPLINHLALYDLVNTPGVAADLLENGGGVLET
jgi:hypothetical protein